MSEITTVTLALPASIVPMIEELITQHKERARLVYEGVSLNGRDYASSNDIGALAWSAAQYSLCELIALGHEPLMLTIPIYALALGATPRLRGRRSAQFTFPPNQDFFERLGGYIVSEYAAATGQGNPYEYKGKPASISHLLDLHIAMDKRKGAESIAQILDRSPFLEYEYRRIQDEQLKRWAYISSPDSIGHTYNVIEHQAKEHREALHRRERGQFGPMEGDFYVEELSRIWATLSHMDEDGNTGHYGSYFPAPARWFAREPRYAPIRKVTIFYSKGWGFRLRKKTPRHWRDAFTAMFPKTVAQLTGENTHAAR